MAHQSWWNEPKPEYPPIVGWWTIGEAPNYEVNDEGVVRHRESGRIVRPYKPTPNSAPRVALRGYGKTVNVKVDYLVETGRRYQER